MRVIAVQEDGIPNIPERLKQPWISSKTPICNLYLTGSDSFLFAIMGAMMGGVKTAGIINGPFGFFKIMSTIMRSASGRKAPEPKR